MDIAETIDEVFWMADAGVTRMMYISPGYERVWGRVVRQPLRRTRDRSSRRVHPEDRGAGPDRSVWSAWQPSVRSRIPHCPARRDRALDLGSRVPGDESRRKPSTATSAWRRDISARKMSEAAVRAPGDAGRDRPHDWRSRARLQQRAGRRGRPSRSDQLAIADNALARDERRSRHRRRCCVARGWRSGCSPLRGASRSNGGVLALADARPGIAAAPSARSGSPTSTSVFT
jgi:hypothetical protein